MRGMDFRALRYSEVRRIPIPRTSVNKGAPENDGVGCMGFLEAASLREEAGAIRVLIAIAPQMYGQALAYVLRKKRPQAEVMRVEPGELGGQLEGFDPQLVICNGATDEVKVLATSWVALSYEGRGITATVCLDGRRSTLEDVAVWDVLAIVDEAERL